MRVDSELFSCKRRILASISFCLEFWQHTVRSGWHCIPRSKVRPGKPTWVGCQPGRVGALDRSSNPGGGHPGTAVCPLRKRCRPEAVDCSDTDVERQNYVVAYTQVVRVSCSERSHGGSRSVVYSSGEFRGALAMAWPCVLIDCPPAHNGNQPRAKNWKMFILSRSTVSWSTSLPLFSPVLHRCLQKKSASRL